MDTMGRAEKALPIPDDWDGTPEEWAASGAQLAAIGEALDGMIDAAALHRLAVAAEGKDGHTRVYFIQASSGEIKIGHATSVLRRMSELQIGHPEELSLLGVVLGGKDLECALHLEFAADRIRGEWFRASDRLMARIAELTG